MAKVARCQGGQTGAEQGTDSSEAPGRSDLAATTSPQLAECCMRCKPRPSPTEQILRPEAANRRRQLQLRNTRRKAQQDTWWYLSLRCLDQSWHLQPAHVHLLGVSLSRNRQIGTVGVLVSDSRVCVDGDGDVLVVVCMCG